MGVSPDIPASAPQASAHKAGILQHCSANCLRSAHVMPGSRDRRAGYTHRVRHFWCGEYDDHRIL